MSSRELMQRRRSPARVVGVIAGVIALLLGVAAALGIWLLPPVLAETPLERSTATASITLTDDSATASVVPGAGWLVLGVGPFLPTDARTVVSPDGAYRATLTLLDGPSAPPDAETLSALLERAGRSTDAATATADWSSETLASGVTISYADLVDGAETITVAVVARPDAPVVAHLALVAATATSSAEHYRPVTADLVATASFAAGPAR